MKTNEEIIKQAESYAKKHGFNWICINPRAGKQGNVNLVIMKCHKTNKISKPAQISNIKRGNNIFNDNFSKKSDSFFKKLVDKLGNQNKKIKFYCSNPNMGYTKHNIRLVEITSKENENLKKNSMVGNLKQLNLDPFNLSKKGFFTKPNSHFLKKINDKHKESKYPFKIIKIFKKNNSRFCKVKEVSSGKIRTSRVSDLLRGQNTFNKYQNRVELITIQPMYEQLLKRLNIDYIKEYSLGRKRIDYLLFPKTYRIGLEVKQSDKIHYSGKNQLETYRKLGNLRQYKLSQVLLSDPQGKHKNSLSIKDLEKYLIKLISK